MLKPNLTCNLKIKAQITKKLNTIKKGSIESIKTKQVYSEKNQKTVYLKKTNQEWFPINFQWIPVIKLNNELNKKTNKMKNLVILPIVLLLALISSCSRDTITGSGDLTSEFRNVANFTKVSSEGIFEVTITQGTSQSIEIIADDNIMHKVKTKVVNNELRLYLDDDNSYRDINLQANIAVPRVNGIKNSGAGNVTIYDVMEDGSFNVFNSGSGNISIDGYAESLSIKNEGSGNFYGFLFDINICNVDISGSGNGEVSCVDNLDIHIKGSGDVYYLGSPSIEADISGSGKIIDAN